jgi:hypothetical protein
MLRRRIHACHVWYRREEEDTCMLCAPPREMKLGHEQIDFSIWVISGPHGIGIQNPDGVLIVRGKVHTIPVLCIVPKLVGLGRGSCPQKGLGFRDFGLGFRV